MEFWVCEESCPRRPAWLGLMGRGFYPSTPISPKYVFHNYVFDLFHNMYMNGPSAKQVYCQALQSFIQRVATVDVKAYILA